MAPVKETRRDNLLIGVIDSFQGGERDIMLYSYEGSSFRASELLSVLFPQKLSARPAQGAIIA
ncbi:hypothetical protein HDU86_007325 [Geranomyces michiganensis]|nr:hypothetical protein HDU86_007325 [Geranomyces michiganensis]